MIPRIQIIPGDCLAELAKLPDGSVHCCVTSPPYWGLRDYGVAGQIGLEKTPEEYVAKMVAVFREVRRVLRGDGVLFLNLGDTYCANGGGGESRMIDLHGKDSDKCKGIHTAAGNGQKSGGKGITYPNLKPKDLVGIPWRVAFALQADGWVLRQEIIWEKPNPMPESVTDRCTKAHEQIFLFAKATWSGPQPGIFGHISDEDARWLAMFVDTEGNICIKRSERQDSGRMQYGAQVAFANTSRALLETAQRIVGIGSFHERKGKNAPMFYWQMAGRQARDFLYRIYPFLIVKQRQAALAIHVQDVLNTNGKKRPGGYRAEEHTAFLETAWARMKLLNHFGSPDLSDVPIPDYGRWSGCSRYYYDAEAIKDPVSGTAHKRQPLNGKPASMAFKMEAAGRGNRNNPSFQSYMQDLDPELGRNKRSVWTVPTAPYSEAHFATFPPDLIKPCILAGTSAKGCCPKCGAGWERVVEKGKLIPLRGNSTAGPKALTGERLGRLAAGLAESGHVPGVRENITLGWQPTCECGESQTVPATVLDPFGGSGTTGQVSLELGRSAILIELNPEYINLAQKRTRVTPGLPLA